MPGLSHPTEEELRALLTAARTIAIVGASSKPDRPSHGVMLRLQRAGYRTIPVNPNEREVLGEKAYARLEDVPVPVDIVDVFRRSEDTPPIADAAVRIGAKLLWLQEGVVNEEAAARARAGGLAVVMDRCSAVAVAVFGIARTR